jgi:hypothetical protein
VIGFRSRLVGLVGLIPSLLEPFDDKVGPTFAWLAARTGETERLCKVACRALRSEGYVDIHGDMALLTPKGRQLLTQARADLTSEQQHQLEQTQRGLDL